MKKGWIIGCSVAGALVLLCGGTIFGLVYFVFNTLQQFGKPADEFLAQLGNGNTPAAYQSAASGLRAQQTQEQFADAVKRLRLTEYKSSNWTKFDMKNDQATLDGTLTLKDGSTVPVTVSLVNEGGWKVLGVKPAADGVGGGDPERLTTPSEAEVHKLINRDMTEFARAIKSADFTTFHSKLAREFQTQHSADKLKDTFREFIDKKIDLSDVERVKPSITKPASINAEGLLQVEGEYKTRPVHIEFALKYLFQDREWKVLGINVKTKPAE